MLNVIVLTLAYSFLASVSTDPTRKLNDIIDKNNIIHEQIKQKANEAGMIVYYLPFQICIKSYYSKAYTFNFLSLQNPKLFCKENHVMIKIHISI